MVRQFRERVQREACVAVAYAAFVAAANSLLSNAPGAFGSVIGCAGPVALGLLLTRGAVTIVAMLTGFVLAWLPGGDPAFTLAVLCAYVTVYSGSAALIRRAAGRGTEWLSDDRSTAAFLLGCLLLPLVMASVVVFVIRPGFPSQASVLWRGAVSSPSSIVAPGELLLLHWGRECAGLLAFGPLIIVHCGPWLTRWFSGASPGPLVRLTGIQWSELGFHAILSPTLLGLAVWAKSQLGVSAISFALLPTLAAARHGVGLASVALAASAMTCCVAFVQLGWQMALGEQALRTLLISGAVPVILMAALVEQRVQARRKLEQVEREYRSLAAHTGAIREDERTRLCTAIVEVLRPGLTRLKEQIAESRLFLVHGSEEAFRSTMGIAARSVDNLMRTVRRIATDLRPGVLDSLGLDAALAWLVKDFGSRSRTACVLHCPEPVAVGRNISTIYFRLVEDFLQRLGAEDTETRRCVHVSLERSDETVVLSVDVQGGSGMREVELLGIHERVGSVGGSLASFTDDRGEVRTLVARVDCGAS